VPHVLLTSSLNGAPCLSYVYFTAFMQNLVHAMNLQTQIILDISERVCIFPS
jgi:hypothetical protein